MLKSLAPLVNVGVGPEIITDFPQAKRVIQILFGQLGLTQLWILMAGCTICFHTVCPSRRVL